MQTNPIKPESGIEDLKEELSFKKQMTIKEIILKIKKVGEVDFKQRQKYKKNAYLLKKLEKAISLKSWGTTQDCRLLINIIPTLLKFLNSKEETVIYFTINFLSFISGKTNKHLSSFFEKIFKSDVIESVFFDDQHKKFKQQLHRFFTKILCYNSFEFMLVFTLKLSSLAQGMELDEYLCMSLFKMMLWRYPRQQLKKYMDNLRMVSENYAMKESIDVKSHLFFSISLLDLRHCDLSQKIIRKFSPKVKKEYLEVRYRVTENLQRKMWKILTEIPEKIRLLNPFEKTSVLDYITNIMKFKPVEKISEGKGKSKKKPRKKKYFIPKKILAYADETIEEYTGGKRKKTREAHSKEMFEKERWRKVINQKLEKLKKNKKKKYEPTIEECTEESKDTSMEQKTGFFKNQADLNIPIKRLKFNRLNRMQFRPKSLDPSSKVTKEITHTTTRAGIVDITPRKVKTKRDMKSTTLSSFINFDSSEKKNDKIIELASPLNQLSTILSPIHTENSNDVTKLTNESMQSIQRPLKFIQEFEKSHNLITEPDNQGFECSVRTTSSSSKFKMNLTQNESHNLFGRKRSPVKVFTHRDYKSNFCGMKNENEPRFILDLMDKIFEEKDNSENLMKFKDLLMDRPRKYFSLVKEMLFQALKFFKIEEDKETKKAGERILLHLGKVLGFEIILSSVSVISRNILDSNFYVEELKKMFGFLLKNVQMKRLDKHVKISVTMTARKLHLPLNFKENTRLNLSSRTLQKSKSGSNPFYSRMDSSPNKTRKGISRSRSNWKLNLDRNSLTSIYSERKIQHSKKNHQKKKKKKVYRYKRFRDFCVRFSKHCNLPQIMKKLDPENKWVKDYEDCSSGSLDTLTMTAILKKIVSFNLLKRIKEKEKKKETLKILMKYCFRVANSKRRKVDLIEIDEILGNLKELFSSV